MVGWFFFSGWVSCTAIPVRYRYHCFLFFLFPPSSFFLFSHSSTSPELAESGMPHGASGNCHAATGLGGFLLAGTTLSVYRFCCLGSPQTKSIVTGRAGRVWGMASKAVPRRLPACSVCLCLFAGMAQERSVSSGRVTCPFAGRRRPPEPLVTGVGKRRRSKWGFRMTDKSFSRSCLGFGESAGWVGFRLG